MSVVSAARRIWEFPIRFTFLAAGICTILFSSHLTIIIPYIIGAGMFLAGIFGVYNGLARREYMVLKKSQISPSLVLLLVGITVLINAEHSLGFLGVIWGIISLSKGATELNHAMYRANRREKWIPAAVQGLVEISLSLILIMDPFEHFSVHVAFLGLTMMVYSFRSLDDWKSHAGGEREA
ncbi:MAG: DUF308 domain-containing protein [Methanocorpusculum sp.]|nr:DUF308 domain-containing protein [Methanocorpusculum sp.]